jgi:eukaryotic-like serine/threonine-protein kinase
LMPARGNVVYASGYLIYLREKTLMAQPFDAGTLETAGEALPVAEGVEFDLDYSRAFFSASQNGILVYQASSAQAGFQLEWSDRSGSSIGKVLGPAYYGYATLSPDGKRIAFDEYDSQLRNRDIWLYDMARGLKTRFTSDPSVDEAPVWSPDDSRIVFTSGRRGLYDLYWKTTSGAGVEEVLVESPEWKDAWDWSSDGRFIAYCSNGGKSGGDLWLLPLNGKGAGGNRKPFVFLQTEFDELIIQFSPDMRWIAYNSNESGNYQLYVRPFIGPDGQPTINQTREWQVSTNGAYYAKWNRNGKELFYLSGDNKLMAAEIKASGSSFEVGAERTLFEVKTKGDIRFYDVTADGQKLLMGIQVGGQSAPPLTLVTNWDAELKKK